MGSSVPRIISKSQSSQSGDPAASKSEAGRNQATRRKSAATRRAEHSADPFRVEAATTADHHAAEQFLTTVFQSPSPEGFQSLLDDPTYEPCDRLVIRGRNASAGGASVGRALVGHALLSQREMRFGRALLPLGQISWLAAAPECRGRGLGAQLLAEAERRLTADGAVLGAVITSTPRFFHRFGWQTCGRARRSQADARSLLAQLSQPHDRPGSARTIRPWRRVELPALARLYEENTAGAFGPLRRGDDYWAWLITRQAFDQIYVAIDGSNRVELDDDPGIVGYAVCRGERVLELMFDRRRPVVAEQLLARACGEAIETDQHTVSLDAPPDDPLHGLVQSARGAANPRPARRLRRARRPAKSGWSRFPTSGRC